jgi:hypothetical protein
MKNRLRHKQNIKRQATAMKYEHFSLEQASSVSLHIIAQYTNNKLGLPVVNIINNNNKDII